MKAIAMKSPEGGREQPIIYIRTDERSDEVDVTPHAALMPCLPPFFPPSLLPSFPPSSPCSANASIDLSFYRIYRIEGGREAGRSGRKNVRRPPAFLFTSSANEVVMRLRDPRCTGRDAAPTSKFKGARAPVALVRPSVRPVPFPFFSCFSAVPSESLCPRRRRRR